MVRMVAATTVSFRLMFELNEYGMVVDSERPWLGGYFPDGDPGSYFPDFWRWVIEKYKIHSVIDVGCGSGKALRFFHDLGCDVLGVEGIPQRDSWIVEHDYTVGSFIPNRKFDLCWCCEFVEHVEERFMSNYLSTFSCAEMILMTHAQPGQGGHHHVHCQPDEYWIEVLKSIGYKYDPILTAKGKELQPHGYWNWSGLAFRRGDRNVLYDSIDG